MKNVKKVRYTLTKARLKDNVFYGFVHGADEYNKTLCGKDVDYHWWIVDNKFNNERITCKKCLKNINERG